MIRRGDVVTVADRSGGDYTGKPRPAVIVQSDHFQALDSVLICPIASIAQPENLLRLGLQPSPSLPLDKPCWIAVEQIRAVRRGRVGARIGRLSDQELRTLTQRLIIVIGAA